MYVISTEFSAMILEYVSFIMIRIIIINDTKKINMLHIIL